MSKSLSQQNSPATSSSDSSLASQGTKEVSQVGRVGLGLEEAIQVVIVEGDC